MHSPITHEPSDYNCPFCTFLSGIDSKHNEQADIVYQDKLTTAFIAPKWWVNNIGHVVVIPNEHFENIYTISDDALAAVYKTTKKIATAIRATYDCEGTSTKQHNEPAGEQGVWHLHVHVYPRYADDQLYRNHEKTTFVDAQARAPYAKKLRAYLAEHTR